MFWLIPFFCSGAICWLNRERIAAAVSPPRVAARRTFAFGAGPFATSPYLLPRAVGYGSTPYGTGQFLLPPQATQAASPAATPFAYARTPPPLEPSPFVAAASAPPAAPAAGPIALMRCAADGCMIRPEPRAWDDATLGRMPGAFTAPKDFAVYVLSYGPVGWAHVLVNHPEDGAVEGWVQTSSLTDAPVSPPSATPAATPATTPVTSGAHSTSKAANDSKARKAAMTRHLQFTQKQGR